MKLIEFDYKSYAKEKKIVVYGTEAFGRLVHYALIKNHISPDYYVNKIGDGMFQGVPVIGIQQLEKMNQNESLIILLATGAASREVILKLKKAKIDVVYSVYGLLDDIKEVGNFLDPIYQIRYRHLYIQDSFVNEDDLVVGSLDVMVTERCSLKCRKCSNLMQYYQNPKNYDVHEIRKNLDNLLNVVDRLYELRILGGETLMNPDFYKIIDWYKDNDKVKRIVVYVNGTIFPQEAVLEKLVHDKILMRISDYGHLSPKYPEWVAWSERNHIEYELVKMLSWHDLGGLQKHNYSWEQIKYIYATCECRTVPTLIGNKLFNCPYAANAINLGALNVDEAEEDTLNLNDAENLKERVRRFLYRRSYLCACDYCEGRNYGRASVIPNEQIVEPLEYTRRM